MKVVTMSRSYALRAVLAALVVACSAATLSGSLADTAPAAKATSPWLTIPAFWPLGTGPEVVGSASGRGWLGFAVGDGESRSTRLGSLRRAGGKPSFVTSSLPRSQRPMVIVGSQLYYHLPDISGKPGAIRAVTLQANGGVGAPRPLPDDPEAIPPRDYEPLAVAAGDAGDRVVWLVYGCRSSTLNGCRGRDERWWACCSSAGGLSDLTRLLQRYRFDPRVGYPQLQRDLRGRLWLAWLESSRSVKLLELDPETLAPRTPVAASLPGGGNVQRAELSCAAVCRMVIEDFTSGGILVSSPGRRTSVKMVSPTSRVSPVNLLAVSDRSGDLVVASAEFLNNGSKISLVRSDGRGSNPRRVGASVTLPGSFGSTASAFLFQPPINAAFVPGGLVYFATYYGTDQSKTRVLAGFLPAR
jgi:hypothetical protein